MAMQKIKKDDMVIVLAGRDKGRTGKVIKLIDQRRALVEGVNMVKKHVRANPQAGEKGGIQEREAKIDLSNLALLNPLTNKADRVGIKTLEDGKKVRYFKSNNEVVDAE